MVMINIFEQDIFSTIALTTAVEKVPFRPTGIGDLGIFEDDPIRTTIAAIEERQGQLILIPTSPRGGEGTQRIAEKRKARFFNVPRLMHSDTIRADELQGIREFGQETVLMQVEAEVARRTSGPTGLQANLEYTWEYHRLAAVQGILLDAPPTEIVNGQVVPTGGPAPVLYNFFEEFGIAPPATIQFNLAAGTANSLRPIINQLVRTMARKAQGAFTPDTYVVALCGDDFYDAFVNHPDVIRTFVNWSDARDIRDGDQGRAFSSFSFAGVEWNNYRGSNDQETIAIPSNAVKFFPAKAPGIFKRILAPGESVEWVNTPGKPQYIIPIFDRDRRAWWKMEMYSYPLHICTRPEVLMQGEM